MTPTKFITAADGTKIAYAIEGTGPALVLSNGIGCNEIFLQYQTEALKDEYRVLNWHYRGHMRSGIPADLSHVDYSYLLDDLKQILDEAGIERAVFVGFSMGVEINFEFYRRWPEMVIALVPICGAFEFCMKKFFNIPILHFLYPGILLFSRNARWIVDPIWKASIGGPLAFTMAKLLIFNRKKIKVSDFEQYHPHISNIDTACFIEMGGYLSEHTARDLLPKIKVPTLVIAGTKDNFTPVGVSREMASLIPGASIIEIEGGSHGTTLEFPEEVNDAILTFVKGITEWREKPKQKRRAPETRRLKSPPESPRKQRGAKAG